MQTRNNIKYPVLLSLYIGQAVPMSFVSTVIPVIMRQQEYSLTSIGLLQLVKLPWILKFLWAPMVDKSSLTGKSLKKWIIVSEFFYATTIAAIAFLNLEIDFNIIILLLILAFTASATQDIATDAYAISILKPEERGLGNSMQSAGSFTGTILGSGALLLIYNYLGWQNMYFALSAFVLLILLPLLSTKFKTNIYLNEKKKITFKDSFSFFKQKDVAQRIVFLAFAYSGIIGLLTMLKPFMVDIGYKTSEIGVIVGIAGTGSGIISGLLAGIIIKKQKTPKSFALFLSILLLSAISFTVIQNHTDNKVLIYLVSVLIWSSYGMMSVAIYTFAMNNVRKGLEGTDFTTQIVITHLSSLIIAISSGKISDIIGYSGLAKIEVLLSLLSVSFYLMFYQNLFNKKQREVN